MADIRSRGFDHIRLLWLWEQLEPRKGKIDPVYLSLLDYTIGACEKNNVNVILDCHQDMWSYPYMLRETGKKTGHGMPYWLEPKDWWNNPNESGWYSIWRFLAKRYDSRTNVLGFDLFNEPWDFNVGGPSGPAFVWSQQRWTCIINELIKVVREVSNKTVYVQMSYWGSCKYMQNMVPVDDPIQNVVYSWHWYPEPGTNLDQELAPAIAFQRRHMVRYWVGEFSNYEAWNQERYDMLARVLEKFKQYGWNSWCFWMYHQAQSPPIDGNSFKILKAHMENSTTSG